MNHTVAGFDVGGNDCGVVNHHRAILDAEFDGCALESLHFQTVGHIGGHRLRTQDVIEQNLGQVTAGVGQQRFHSAGGQGGKSLVGRGKDSEGTFAGEGIHQTGRTHRGDQCLKTAGSNRRLHNIHFGHGRGLCGRGLGGRSRCRGRWRRRRSAGRRQQGESQKQCYYRVLHHAEPLL